MILALFLLQAAIALPTPRQNQVPRQGSSAADTPQYRTEDLASITGYVRNATTGEPLRKATLVLIRQTGNRGGAGGVTSTDNEGKFSLRGIEPGQYRLSADRNGFVRSEYGARPGARQGSTITLDKSQNLSEVEIRLTPQAVVTGRVLDEDGEPVLRSQVQLLRLGSVGGRKQLVPSSTATTNDLGEFRIHGVAAGKYYLKAVNDPLPGVNWMADRGLRPRVEENYSPTYYPGATDGLAASQTVIIAGAQVQGMDITLRKTRTYRVAGRVTGIPAGTGRGRGASVTMISRGSSDGSQLFAERFNSQARGAGGAFEIRGVRPGSYVLLAEAYGPNDTRLTGRVPVDVGEGNVEGVSAVLQPGLDVSGSVKLDDKAELSLDDLSIELQPAVRQFRSTGNSSAKAESDGKFSLDSIVPDRYFVTLRNLPAGFYLKSARMGEADILKTGADFSQMNSSVSGIVLAVSSKAARVQGVVTDEKGNPLPGATVVLSPPLDGSMPHLSSKTASTDQNGQYTFQSLPPADYLMYAFETIETAEAQDPDLLKQYERSAVKATLSESGQDDKPLKIIKLEH